MNPAKNIFLVGMPGSGKSTLGKLVANKLRLDFYDLDVEIEKDQNKTIAEIFNERGEELFRKIESTTLSKTINNKKAFVMATGGGTPCFLDGIGKMNNCGITVYLDTSIELLIERIGKKSHRPLLKKNQSSTMRELLELRNNCYSQATYRLDTDGLSLNEKADKIVDL